ncbi:leucine-rich repeat-containing 71-like isoform X5 [Brachionus plicatilis]|uniref:Leucine-rich repeat-containing 71-like isoform X5 n=1 Tax=Brachionus plicatilis TaxID=10195 RepID=A0A3M7SW19_BRAPC|nr:leucine-rich repeat-containing 71-like isoform X5 [Brachionus plicatilis]
MNKRVQKGHSVINNEDFQKNVLAFNLKEFYQNRFKSEFYLIFKFISQCQNFHHLSFKCSAETDDYGNEHSTRLKNLAFLEISPLTDIAEFIDDKLWLLGNRTLLSLNLSRNELTEKSVNSFLMALSYQKTFMEIHKSQGTGLLRLMMTNNDFSSDYENYIKLTELMKQRDPVNKNNNVDTFVINYVRPKKSELTLKIQKILALHFAFSNLNHLLQRYQSIKFLMIFYKSLFQHESLKRWISSLSISFIAESIIIFEIFLIIDRFYILQWPQEPQFLKYFDEFLNIEYKKLTKSHNFSLKLPINLCIIFVVKRTKQSHYFSSYINLHFNL